MTNGDMASVKASSRVPTFRCRGCLDDVPLSSRSWDFRYCRSCCSFLANEAKERVGVNESKAWVPKQSPSPINLWFEEGDRVQLLAPQNIDGILDEWMMVSSATQGLVTVIVGTKVKQVQLSKVVAHQKADYCRDINIDVKGEDEMVKKKQNPTPTENYSKVKQTLDRLVSSGADARIIGLWKSKLEHAERMCKDVGIDPTVVATTATVPSVQEADSATDDGDGGEREEQASATPLGKIERVGDEMPPEVKAVVAVPKAQRSLKKATPVAEKPPKGVQTASKEPTLCLCGCGGQTSHHREFLQGHDARLGSYIRKLDAGKLKLEELPESVQKLVKDNHSVVVRIRSHIAKK